MDYIIEHQNGNGVEEAISKLQNAVIENIKLGFVPIGGVTIVKESNISEQYVAAQAMIK